MAFLAVSPRQRRRGQRASRVSRAEGLQVRSVVACSSSASVGNDFVVTLPVDGDGGAAPTGTVFASLPSSESSTSQLVAEGQSCQAAAQADVQADVQAAVQVAAQVARLERVVQELSDLALLGWSDVPGDLGDRVVRLTERSSRAVAAIQTSAIAGLAKQAGDAKHGTRGVKQRLERNTGRSAGSAARAVKAAEHLEKDLPETRAALARGEISEDHVNAIVRWATKTPKHKERLKDPVNGEKRLLDQARRTNATQFAKIAQGWATETDPKAADREFAQSSKTQTVNLTPVDDGFLLKGVLNHVDGQVLQTALASHMGRKAADDTRSYPERRAEALIGLARQSLDEGRQKRGARIRPHLTVTLDYGTLEALVQATEPPMPESLFNAHDLDSADHATREAAITEWAASWQPGDDHVISTNLNYDVLEGVAPATLPDGTPLAPAALSRLACESMLARVVFGPESTILDAGREQRIFPAHQVRAIIARDQHCQYPGCDEGPEFSEVHHSLEWYKHGGTTHADLGILLCYAHHSHVHRAGITISRTSGRWIFTDASTRVIAAPDLAAETAPTDECGGGKQPLRLHGESSAHPPESGSSRSGPPRVVIPAGDPLCPDLNEEPLFNLDPNPPF